ncbi:MAG: acetyl-CoA carboxylase carboxyltransferase subunit alpha [Defluviitaleaceae bacterium]|nr:acetyl-CoA carboxylase carboxyltransferase subunit alpha [Defluviitaleaceae bacterium]
MDLKEIENQIEHLRNQLAGLDENDVKMQKLRQNLAKAIDEMKAEVYQNLDAYDKVYLARHPKRPNTKFYIEQLFDDFLAFHGDRLYGDDDAIIGGVAMLGDLPVTVIGHVKGTTLDENVKSNFGMPHPEGYRKAIRLALQAEKFGRPIVTFVDTPGAYPGVGAEERGQAEAIARCLMIFMGLKVPVITVVIGEGGSGGALAISGGNHLIMLEHSVYSVLSPEGFASILYKDATRAKEAAGIMKLTADDLLGFGIIDEIIKEPLSGAHEDPEWLIPALKEALTSRLSELMKLSAVEVTEQRYQKFQKMGGLKR